MLILGTRGSSRNGSDFECQIFAQSSRGNARIHISFLTKDWYTAVNPVNPTLEVRPPRLCHVNDSSPHLSLSWANKAADLHESGKSALDIHSIDGSQ